MVKIGEQVAWTKYGGKGLAVFHQMGYANPQWKDPSDHGGEAAVLVMVKDACIRLGCAAVKIESNGWLTYHPFSPSRIATSLALLCSAWCSRMCAYMHARVH